jgi:hypothetical protein
VANAPSDSSEVGGAGAAALEAAASRHEALGS